MEDIAAPACVLSRIRDTLDSRLRDRRKHGQQITDLLIYYVGHARH
jgi:hypothetical protein